MTKFLTLKEVAQSIEDNGLPQAFGAYFEESEDGKLMACALGQAAYNLKVTTTSLERELNRFNVKPAVEDSYYYDPTNEFYSPDKVVYLGSYITRLNDLLGWDFKRIAEFVRGATRMESIFYPISIPVNEDEHDWH